MFSFYSFSKTRKNTWYLKFKQAFVEYSFYFLIFGCQTDKKQTWLFESTVDTDQEYKYNIHISEKNEFMNYILLYIFLGKLIFKCVW